MKLYKGTLCNLVLKGVVHLAKGLAMNQDKINMQIGRQGSTKMLLAQQKRQLHHCEELRRELETNWLQVAGCSGHVDHEL